MYPYRVLVADIVLRRLPVIPHIPEIAVLELCGAVKIGAVFRDINVIFQIFICGKSMNAVIHSEINKLIVIGLRKI